MGPITALAFSLTIGDVRRFKHSNQVASYLGLIPAEYTSANKRRLGGISKQGNSFLRMLLVEAAQSVVRLDPQFRKDYDHLCRIKHKAVAKGHPSRGQGLVASREFGGRNDSQRPKHAQPDSRMRLA